MTEDAAAGVRGSALRDAPVRAAGDEVGSLDDVLFDEVSWAVRHLVVVTGGWLGARRGLIEPAAVTAVGEAIDVSLSREEVEAAPPPDAGAPLSPSEIDVHGLYAWPPYWLSPGMSGPPVVGPPAGSAPLLPAAPAGDAGPRSTHVRSARDVTGCHIRARDDEAGHVRDVTVDCRRWSMKELLVGARDVLAGRTVALAVSEVEAIDLRDRLVRVRLTRAEVEALSPRR